MQVMAVGLNHETAPVELRERVAISADELPGALTALRAVPGVHEAAVLSTCNRTELYVAAGPELAPGSLGHFLPTWRALPPGGLGQSLYVHQGPAAVQHLCKVAAGLNSAVLGETQILAQVKQAYQTAAGHGTLGPYLHQVFNLAIATAKQVHTDTAVGLQPVSMGSVTMQVIRKVFAQLGLLHVLVVGTGKMGRTALNHLAEAGVGAITVASRSTDRARRVAGCLRARHVDLEGVAPLLPQVQVVMTATSGPALGLAAVRAACAGRKTPLLIIDLGVPRNVDPAAGDLPEVVLFNVDDLKEVAAANLEQRRQGFEKARAIVEDAAGRFVEWVASRKVVPLLRSLSEVGERIRQQELDRALARLGPLSEEQWAVVEELTRSLSRRLLHECRINLKRSAAHAISDGRETVRLR